MGHVKPSHESPARVAVVGHVEWVEFAAVERLPLPGEIVQAREHLDLPAGGGAVAAVQIAKLNGGCLFFTAVGNDPLGNRIAPELEKFGVTVRAAPRQEPQRRAFVHLDDSGERTITTLGPRLRPVGEDDLGWQDLERCDAVYITAGDRAAIEAAGRARKVVATVRAAKDLFASGVRVDVLLASRNDPGEQIELEKFTQLPRALVRTDGPRGGTIERPGREIARWQPLPLPGPWLDAYGAGDSFAGGLTFGLGVGLDLEAAASLGGLCGAMNLTGRGPYAGQATAEDFARWRTDFP